ncbi:MAG: hypothetical protein COA78_22045 [Blastopirellula sp.]|nr:MAG: hypothetical protein COA78_22045 [Blastopirellula sp.]
MKNKTLSIKLTEKEHGKIMNHANAIGVTASSLVVGMIDELSGADDEKLPYDTTGYALLDVGKGRAKLAKAIDGKQKFKVSLEANVLGRYGSDDGVSIEFSLDITKFKIQKR